MRLRFRFDNETHSRRIHIQAAHVNPDAAVVGLLLVLCDLVQQVEVGPGVLQMARECVTFLWVSVRFGVCSDTDLNVFAEVPDGFCPRILQVVVDPAQQELLRGERHQVVQSLPIEQKGNQA